MRNNISLPSIWIIGAGQMALEHAKVLKAINYNFMIIGRGEKNIELLKEKIDCLAITGGVEKYIKETKTVPECAIVAVNLTQLGNTCMFLLENGCKKILVEKPAGLNYEEIKKIDCLSNEKGADVFVGYNRRFYASVLKAQKIIQKDEGIKSFNFEFTEWAHVIRKANKKKEELENWFLANSSHVVDLAFFLGGNPVEMSSYIADKTDWYEKAAVFSGAGYTETGALFSYQANWNAPGRWGIELLTEKHKLILRPLEKLQIQDIGSIQSKYIDIDDELDLKFKPGIFLQDKAFLENDYQNLLTISEQKKNLKFYHLIEQGNYENTITD